MDEETSRITTVTANETESGKLLEGYKDMAQEQENQEGNQDKFVLFTLTAIVEVLALISLILTGIWTGHYRGGFAWDGSFKEFNYHPVFMVTGMVVLYGNSILVYRVFRDTEKIYVKIIHAACLLTSFIFSVMGLVAVFDFHNINLNLADGSHHPIPNMYSLHSWLGLTVVILFGCQFLIGFVSFLWPKFSDGIRATYLTVHVYFGVAIFAGAIASCLLGLTEKALFSIRDTYSKFVPEGLIINVLGIILVLFGGLVGHLVTHHAYKRPPEGRDSLYSAVS